MTGALGVALFGCALVLVGVVVGDGEGLSTVGWLVLVALLVLGAASLRRATAWTSRFAAGGAARP